MSIEIIFLVWTSISELLGLEYGHGNIQLSKSTKGAKKPFSAMGTNIFSSIFTLIKKNWSLGYVS